MDSIEKKNSTIILAKAKKRSFRCKHCSKTFIRRNSLRRHMLGHVTVKPFQCQICGTGFCHKSSYRRHKKNDNCATRIQKKPVEASKSGQKKPVEASESVQKTKYNRVQFKCPMCGVGFAHKYTFKTHLVMNSCTVEGRSQGEILPISSQTTGDSVDNRSDEDLGALSSGKEILFDKSKDVFKKDKPSKLSNVSKESIGKKAKVRVKVEKMSSDSSPKSHKTYACGMCGKTTKSTYGLKAHSLRCTGNAVPECTICHRIYSSHVLLRRHMKRHREEDKLLPDKDYKKKLHTAQTQLKPSLLLKKKSKSLQNVKIVTNASSSDSDGMTVYIPESMEEQGNVSESSIPDVISSNAQMSEDPLLDHSVFDAASYNNETLSKSLNDVPSIRHVDYPDIDDHPTHINSQNRESLPGYFSSEDSSGNDVMGVYQDQSDDDDNTNEIATVYIEESTDNGKKDDEIEFLGDVKVPEGKSGNSSDPLMRENVNFQGKCSSLVEVKMEPNEDDDQKHTCDICGFLCHQKSILRKHMADQHGETQKFKCSICWGDFLFQSDLIKHMETHESKRFSCHFCPLKFMKKCGLVGHLRTHINAQEYECDICGMTFAAKTPFLRHVKEHVSKKRKRYKRKKHINDQGVTKNSGGEQGVFPESISEQESSRVDIRDGESTLKDVAVDPHVRMNSILTNFTVVYDIETIQNDTALGNMSKKYQCRFCDQVFEGRAGLEQHVGFHKTSGDIITKPKPYKSKTFSCTMCPKKFSKKCHLVRHYTVHRIKGCQICEFCNLPFDSTEEFAIHQKEHILARKVKVEAGGSTHLPPLQDQELELGKLDTRVDGSVDDTSVIQFADNNVKKESDIDQSAPVRGKESIKFPEEDRQDNQNDSEKPLSSSFLATRTNSECEPFSTADNADLSDTEIPFESHVEGEEDVQMETSLDESAARLSMHDGMVEGSRTHVKDLVALHISEDQIAKLNSIASNSSSAQHPNILSKDPHTQTISTEITQEQALEKINIKETSLFTDGSEPKVINELKASKPVKVKQNSLPMSFNSTVQVKKNKSNSLFKCRTCGKGFKKKSCLGMHSRIHRGNRPFPCVLCEQTFCSAASLHLHMYKHGTSASVSYARELSKQIRKKNNHKIDSSEDLQESSNPGVPLSDTLTDNSNKESASQALGDTTLDSSASTYEFKEDTDVRPSKRIRKSTSRYVDETMGIDFDDFKLKCPHCPRRCQTRCGLANHIKSHINYQHYPCNTCNITFYFQETLDSHLKNVHPDVKVPDGHLNSREGIQIKQENDLDASQPQDYGTDHDMGDLLTNSGANTNLEALTKFKEEDSKEKSEFKFELVYDEENQRKRSKPSYRCANCRRTFRYFGRLKTHQRMEVCTVRPYACSVPGCEVSFKRRFNLKRHLTRHFILKCYSAEKKNNSLGEDNSKNTLESTSKSNLYFTQKKNCPLCGKDAIDGLYKHMKECPSIKRESKNILEKPDVDISDIKYLINKEENSKHSSLLGNAKQINKESTEGNSKTLQKTYMDGDGKCVMKWAHCKSKFHKKADYTEHVHKAHPGINILDRNKELKENSLPKGASPFSKLTEKLLKQKGDNKVISQEKIKKEVLNSEKENHYDCAICGRNTLRTVDFAMHLSFHKDREELEMNSVESSHTLYDLVSLLVAAPSCTVCRKVFCMCKSLQLGSDNENFDFCKCDICGSRFIDKWTLVDHMSSHGRNVDVSLLIEDMKAYLTKSLEKHNTQEEKSTDILSTQEGDNFPCNICEEVFPFPTEYLVHLSTHSKRISYECSLCHKLFQTQESHDNHVALHEMSEEVVFCNLTVSDGLITLSNSDDVEDKVSGTLEGNACKTEEKSLDSLMAKDGDYKASAESRKSSCKVSKMSGTTALKMEGETAGNSSGISVKEDPDHSGEGTYECPFCNKSFARYQKLLSHQKLHLESVYECEKCKLSFQSKEEYDEHLISEDHKRTSKYFECPLCGKKIINSANFLRHYASHTPLMGTSIVPLIPGDETKSSPISAVDQLQEELDWCDEYDQDINSLSNLEMKEEEEMPSSEDVERKSPTTVTKRVRNNSNHCNICGQKFQYDSELKNHLYTHGFTCNMCGHKFDRKSKYKTHVTRHSPSDRKCQYCWRSFLRKREYDLHLPTHGVYPSKEVSNGTKEVTSIKKKKNVLKDSKELIYDPLFGERKIDDNLESNPKTKKSKMIGANKKVHVCPVCKRKYEDYGRYCEHRKLHAEVAKLRCDICSEIFKTKAALLEHKEKSHESIVLYSCPECKDCFSDHKSLSLHLKKHKGVEVKSEQPEVLSTQEDESNDNVSSANNDIPSTSTNSLETDDSLLSVDHPFSCHICSRRFKTLYYLKCHSEIHVENKPFTCHVCHKSYASSRRFRRHMESHFLKRRYPCSQCTKFFTYRYVLVRHLQKVHKFDEKLASEVASQTNEVDCKEENTQEASKFLLPETDMDTYQIAATDNNGIAITSYDIGKTGSETRVVPVSKKVKKKKVLDTETKEVPVSVSKKEKKKKVLDIEASEAPVTKKEKKKKIEVESGDDTLPDVTLDDITGGAGKKRCICPLCRKVCSCSSNLNDHIISHASDKPWMCPPCGIKFKRLWDRNRHIRNKHSQEPKVFLSLCQENKKGIDPAAKRYDCPQCQKNFLYDSVFKMHMMFHAGKSDLDFVAGEEEEYYECAVERNEDDSSMIIEHVVVDEMKSIAQEFTLDDTEKDYVIEDVAIDIKEEVIDVDDIEDVVIEDFDVFGEMVPESGEINTEEFDAHESEDRFDAFPGEDDRPSYETDIITYDTSGEADFNDGPNIASVSEISLPTSTSDSISNGPGNTANNAKSSGSVGGIFISKNLFSKEDDESEKCISGVEKENRETLFVSDDSENKRTCVEQMSPVKISSDANERLETDPSSEIQSLDDEENDSNAPVSELDPFDEGIAENSNDNGIKIKDNEISSFEKESNNRCDNLTSECKSSEELDFVGFTNSSVTEIKKKRVKDNVKSTSISLPKKNVYCVLCDLSFSTTKQLFGHIHIHPGLVFYQCDVCGETMKSSKVYREHALSHIIGYFDCNDEAYIVSEVKEGSPKKIGCGFCGKSFSTRHQLQGHFHIHSNEFSRYCEACGENFISNRLALAHLYNHLTLLFKGPAAAHAKLSQEINEPIVEEFNAEKGNSDSIVEEFTAEKGISDSIVEESNEEKGINDPIAEELNAEKGISDSVEEFNAEKGTSDPVVEKLDAEKGVNDSIVKELTVEKGNFSGEHPIIESIEDGSNFDEEETDLDESSAESPPPFEMKISSCVSEANPCEIKISGCETMSANCEEENVNYIKVKENLFETSSSSHSEDGSCKKNVSSDNVDVSDVERKEGSLECDFGPTEVMSDSLEVSDVELEEEESFKHDNNLTEILSDNVEVSDVELEEESFKHDSNLTEVVGDYVEVSDVELEGESLKHDSDHTEVVGDSVEVSDVELEGESFEHDTDRTEVVSDYVDVSDVELEEESFRHDSNLTDGEIAKCEMVVSDPLEMKVSNSESRLLSLDKDGSNSESECSSNSDESLNNPTIRDASHEFKSSSSGTGLGESDSNITVCQKDTEVSNLSRDSDTVHKPYSCMYCHKRFKFKINMRFHMRLHTGEEVLKCKVCAKKFLRKSRLLEHEKEHSGV